MHQVKTALIGLGSVHRNLLQILADKKERLRREHGVEFLIVAIADSSGVAISEGGFDPVAIIAHKEAGKAVADLPSFAKTIAAENMVDAVACDLVFEASPVDLKTGGIGLAISRKALSKGISVVLANKAPLVLAFAELKALAAKSGAGLKYSATFCGGLPVINIGERDLIAGDILKLQGIFNSTSNYILDGMADGRSYDDTLREAQERGIAEADPSLDVGGWDTANKLLIVANSIMAADISLGDIEVEGIEHIDVDYVIEEKKKGNVVKLVAKAEQGAYSVGPVALPEKEFLAQCTGWEMAVELHTDIYGIGYYKLWEREPVPTAGSMLRDALHIFA